MEYFIFYINFEEKIIPIYCHTIEDDPIIEGYTLFKGVKHLDDKAFPKLKVNQISLPKKDIKYYLKGIEIEEELIISDKTEVLPQITDSKMTEITEINDASPEKIKGIKAKQKVRRKFSRKY